MVRTMEWQPACLVLLDQTKLPTEVTYIECKAYQRVCQAIQRLEVRGAPAIGAAAAYAMVLGFKEVTDLADLEQTYARIRDELIAARPTAVNLAWGAKLMYQAALDMKKAGLSRQECYHQLEALANKVYAADIAINKKLGAYGAEVMPENAVILTHCNAGALATCGWGTALGVIRSGAALGKVKRVYSDETRPLLQGSRLTAWELLEDKLPVTTITDNMAAWTMKTKGVNMVVVGADRIAGNGDTANKIGTFGVALAAKALGIPFYIAAPASTFDFELVSGAEIPIEERNPEEVKTFQGVVSAPPGVEVFNPAFDVTPNELISGIITEYGVLQAPYTEAITNLHKKVLEEEQFTWKV